MEDRKVLALGEDGLPTSEALQQLTANEWADWMLGRAMGTDSFTGVQHCSRDDSSFLALIEQALAKAPDVPTRERHFFGAIQAASTLWLKAQAEAAPTYRTCLLYFVRDVLWHIARTARPEFGCLLGAASLEALIRKEILSVADAPRMAALQALASLHLPKDVSFWMERLKDPDSALLALDTMLDRGVSDPAGLLAQAVQALGVDSWCDLHYLVENLIDKRGLVWVRQLLADADANLQGDDRFFLRRAVKDTAAALPDDPPAQT